MFCWSFRWHCEPLVSSGAPCLQSHCFCVALLAPRYLTLTRVLLFPSNLSDTLEYFAHLKTLIATIRAAQGEDGPRNKVIAMLTGDFLSPYLLSSVDRGAGMMHALAATPIDYLTWGNHGASVRRMRSFSVHDCLILLVLVDSHLSS